MDNSVYHSGIPPLEEFIKGYRIYEKNEPRGAMYKVATFLVSHFWGESEEMTNGLGVLLLTWNQAFYRYGGFDFFALEKCLVSHFDTISEFRGRKITSLEHSDKRSIFELFEAFLIALEDPKGRKSPVAVSKAFHLLAPNFFPLWDKAIAKAYKCGYSEQPEKRYLEFCWIMKSFAAEFTNYIKEINKPILKLIDQYNYSKYTKGWI